MAIYEIILGLFLLFKKLSKIIMINTSLIFIFFLLISIYGNYKGYNENCGCFGDLVSSNFDGFMIARNLLFVIMVFFTMILSAKEKIKTN